MIDGGRWMPVARGLAVALLIMVAGVVQAQSLPKDTLAPGFWKAPWPFGLGDPPSAFQRDPDGLRIALGRRLFFSPVLSDDRTVACASCHRPDHGFSSPEALPSGVHGRHALRHPPSLYNRALGTLHSWDGRARSLREQVIMPIENPDEMGLPLEGALSRLRADSEWSQRFVAAFGSEGITRERLSDALASFVERLTLGDSPVDRFQAAHDRTALTVPERAGLWIYESKGRCWTCHSGPNFSDEQFHNTGVGVVGYKPQPGRFAVTGREEDRGRFRTPTLRGLAHTAPYMHDGSLGTLEEVVAFYRRGGHQNSHRDHRLRLLDLTDEDAANLVAFLGALSRRARD